MIDFQNGGLEHQVYELITKMCDLGCSDEFPKFETRELENGKWECALSIPGVKTASAACGRTEADSINQCASIMLSILEADHGKGQFDPDVEGSIFKRNIEQFFGDVCYDKGYKYRVYETDILINPHTAATFRSLGNYAADAIQRLGAMSEELDRISDIVTIRLLAKERKKGYC